MKNILNEIMNNKQREVRLKMKSRDFLGALKNPISGDISIIAEYKLASPSAGRFVNAPKLEEQVIRYEKSYADAISLIVDKKYFDGALEFIRRAKRVVNLPILVKDFIIDPYQIYEMKVYGADAVLLIAKTVSPEKLKEFVNTVYNLGMEPVVEVNNEGELEMALQTDATCIAVNARDLNDFSLNIKKACALGKLIPQDKLFLGFSGIKTRKDVEAFQKAGAKAVLIGTALMKAKNVQEEIRKLRN